MANVHFSSDTVEWATPMDVFDELNKAFGPFDLDPCSTKENAKCPVHYTKSDNGLALTWGNASRVFMNPPYGRGIFDWIRKAYSESVQHGITVVCLLPARTDTEWFHTLCVLGQIYFRRGRIKFGGSLTGAPFPSMAVVFGPGKNRHMGVWGQW